MCKEKILVCSSALVFDYPPSFIAKRSESSVPLMSVRHFAYRMRGAWGIPKRFPEFHDVNVFLDDADAPAVIGRSVLS